MYICKNVIFCFSISKSLLFIFFEAHPEMHLAKTTRPMILRIFILASLLWTNITKFVLQLLMSISSSYCTFDNNSDPVIDNWISQPRPKVTTFFSDFEPWFGSGGGGHCWHPWEGGLTPPFTAHPDPNLLSACPALLTLHSYGLDLGRNDVFFLAKCSREYLNVVGEVLDCLHKEGFFPICS